MTWWRSKLLWIALLSVGCSFLLGFLIRLESPKVKAWVILRIDRLSREKLPVHVIPGTISWSWLPLTIDLQDVRIIPKAEIQPVLDPLNLQKVSIELNLFQLVQGRVRISRLGVQGTDINVRVPVSEKKSTPPLKGLFAVLESIPIGMISLDDVNLHLKMTDPLYDVDIDRLRIDLEKTRDGLFVDGEVSAIYVLDRETGARIRMDWKSRLLAGPDEVSVEEFRLRRGESYLQAAGDIKGDVEALKFEQVTMKAEGGLALGSMRNWLVGAFPRFSHLPKLDGRVTFQSSLRKLGKDLPQVSFAVQTERLKIDRFLLGSIDAKGDLTDNVVKVPRLTLNNESAGGSFDNISVRLEKGAGYLSADGDVKRFDLHRFLFSMGVDAPVMMQVQTRGHCEGPLWPEFKLQCQAKMRGENAIVKVANKAPTPLIHVPLYGADAQVEFNKEGVSFSTAIDMPHSNGRARGQVLFHEGFKIDFEANELHFSDIAALADLKIEGHVRARGSTQGNSSAAVFSMSTDAYAMWLQDFYLGDSKGEISYANGTLRFDDMQGHYAATRYQGDLALNFHEHTMQLSAKSPFLDISDLFTIFARKADFHPPVSGTGNFQFKAWGPINIHQLNYDLRSNLYRGYLAAEPFELLRMDLHSRNGEIRTDNVILQKSANQLIAVSGVMHADQTVEANVKGSGFRLEQSKILGAITSGVAGALDFDVQVTGPIKEIQANAQGTVSNMTLAEEPVPVSKFRFKLGGDTLDGTASLLGETIKVQATLPLRPQAPFALDLQVNDWNYTPFFTALTGGRNIRRDFDGTISANAHLAASSGGIWNSTGTATVNNFLLRRGPLRLTNSEPIKINVEQGQVRVEKGEIAGDNTFFRVSTSTNPVTKMDLQVNGKLDLNLLSIFLPFLEDLRGSLSLAFNIRAAPQQFGLIGSAYVDKGFIKLPALQHPFENIKADVLFSEKKVTLSSIKSDVGGGRLTGDGTVEFRGYKDIPVNINASIEKVTLNLPDGYKSTGSGQLTFTGNWFPFLLKGQYDIVDGKVSKEFGGGDGNKPQSSRFRAYLPNSGEENFVPLILDLQVNFPRGVEVKNSLVEGRVSGQINVKGPPERVSLLGNINTEKDTKVIFKETPFEVIAGNIEFTNPSEINPKLYVSARTRVQDYDVNLLIQGYATDPKFILSSSPPKPEKDIITLLVMGVSGGQYEDGVNSQQKTAGLGGQVGTSILQQTQLGKEFKDRLGVDLQFSSGFDENGAVQKISLSKKLTPRLDVSGAQSIGDNNSKKHEVRMKYRVTNRVSVGVSYEGQDQTSGSAAGAAATDNLNRVGLDADYRFEFK